MWYHRTSAASAARSWTRGGRRRPAAIMITPLPGMSSTKPGSATRAFPGIEAEMLDDEGQARSRSAAGSWRITSPWPGMLRTIWGDDERYRDDVLVEVGRPTSTSRATAPSGTTDGYFWLLGPRGRRAQRRRPPHRHDGGGERAGGPPVPSPRPRSSASTHELKGQAIAAFVTLKTGCAPDRRAAGRAQGARGEEDRRARPARRHPLLRRTCPRPAPARSCAGCCATSPRGGPSATRRRSPIPAVVAKLKEQYEETES